MKGQSVKTCARLCGYMTALLLAISGSAQAQPAQSQLPPPPLPVDSRPISDLLSDAERASIADALSNSKRLIETYLKIAETHLDSSLTHIRGENARAATDELNIYNKAVAEAGKLTFSQQDGKRKLAKKLEQVLYKHIRTLESIEREIAIERHPYAQDALKRTKQLRVQALNAAFAGGDILKDHDEVEKKEPPRKDGPNNNNRLEPPALPIGNAGSLHVLQPASFYRSATISGRKPVQISGDYLTEEEDEHVREAQEADRRAKVFMKIADRRLAAITGTDNQNAAGDKKAQEKADKELREWGALPKLSRAELLRHYARAIEECTVKLEDAYERNPKSSAIPKALAALKDATDKHLEILRSLTPQMKGESETSALREAIEQAESANKGARDGLK